MAYLERHLTYYLKHYLKKYPIVTRTGPRQSGKTTLAIKSCPDYKYVNLEEPDQREYAATDPRGFLETYSDNAIFDEVQQIPELFSYLQSHVDKDPRPGRYILTGSQQFILNAKISQTLAGRVARLTLLPLSLSELFQRPYQKYWHTYKLNRYSALSEDVHDYLFKGLYPRIFENDLEPQQFFRDYIDTYVTRDLQQLLHVGDLHIFRNFLKMLANRCGQRVNLTSLGNDLGLSHTTIKRWLSVLEASYIIILLEPFYNNFNKRLVKSPKIYFLDTGLLCSLLQINKKEDLPFHSLIGGIFETFVIAEITKSFYHHDSKPPIYFWQERRGRLVWQGESLQF